MKKAFRLFISSTFADFKAERDLLHNEVFPKIREYCEEKGFTFQPIDLRWGVNTEAQFDQKTIPVCLNEVKICASYPHPNFLIMLGDRYGWVPLPYMIERSEFDQILKNTKAQADVNLIKKWYYLDENQIPSSCVLRPRLGKFKNYEMWSAEEERLRFILQKAAVNLPEDKKKKYFMSATHYEFNEIYKDEGNKDYIVSVFRHIKNSKQNREQDIENFRQSVEDNTLKHNVIDEYIDEKFEILNRSEFVEKIENKLKENIDRGIKEVASLPKGSEHNQFKTKELDLFLGREKSLKRIADYLDDDTDTPLIVHSSSGMGKTTLMKKAIENLENDLSDVDIFYRFVGADGKSFYKRDLLTGIIDEMPGENKLDKQDEYKFDEQIKEILSKDSVKKIAIFIDALDQLRVRDALLWLPQKLGKKVKIVLSVLNDENFAEDSGYYRNLLGRYGDRNTLNLNDDSLQCNTKELFDKFLGKYSRKLTDEQMLAVADKFNDANSSPLYAFIIAQELRYLKSGGEIDIANDVPSAVNEFIDNLKNLYYQEERLIQKVLSYIAFSKYGISENELLDLLSEDIKKDKKLQKRVFFIQEADDIVFPTSLWASLYSLLEPFLTLVQKDDKLLINFVHRQFVWAVSKRYEKYKEETHAILAKYFCAFDRKDKLWNERYYSPRALSEIFYHLYHSNSKNLETYLNDLELIGSIYDSEKYEDFREILDILDEDKFFVQKSFYREKDYLIKGVDKKRFTAHTVLFQLAYADGNNSQLTKSAKKLLKDGRVNFPWLQIQKIPKEFKRIGLLGVFDWDYVKKLSNGNLLIGKANGNFCLLSNEFKQIVEFEIKRAHDVCDVTYGAWDWEELENGNLKCSVYEDEGYSPLLQVNYFTDYLFTNNGKLINIHKSNDGIYSEFEYFGLDVAIEHNIVNYPDHSDRYLIWHKEELLAEANCAVVFKDKYLLFTSEKTGLYVYSIDMRLIASISDIEYVKSIDNLQCGHILINGSVVLTNKWQYKCTVDKLVDLSNGKMLINTENCIALLSKNMHKKVLIKNAEFDYAAELKNKKILMQLGYELILFSSNMKQICSIILKSNKKLKKIELTRMLCDKGDHCFSILTNNNLLIQTRNSVEILDDGSDLIITQTENNIRLFSENMEELASIENLNIDNATRLSNNNLLVQIEDDIKLLSENMEELVSIENLNIAQIIDIISDNLPVLIEKKDNVILFSRKNKTISLTRRNKYCNAFEMSNYIIIFEDEFYKKFYSVKTKKLFRALRIQGELVDLNNRILILSRDKTYLYDLELKHSTLKNDNSIPIQGCIMECGYVVLLFENNKVCVYSKTFKKLKTYEKCKSIKVKKHIFAIEYQNGEIEVIDKKLHGNYIGNNYELLENDCISDNILLYGKSGLNYGLCVYSHKYQKIESLKIYSKDISYDNQIGGFFVKGNESIFNQDGIVIQKNTKGFYNSFNGNGWWSYEYSYNKEIFEHDNILTIKIYDHDFKHIDTAYANAVPCWDRSTEIVQLGQNNNIIHSLGICSDYNDYILWNTKIYNKNGNKIKEIENACFIARLNNNDILISKLGETKEIYSSNYAYKKTLGMEKLDFIKELADASLIFTDQNDNTVYYDADYEPVSGVGKFKIDATKHKKFEYFKDAHSRHIFIYHYVPNNPKVIKFYANCEVEEFKESFSVLCGNTIGILYKNIDKTEFYYVPNEAKVIKIYEDGCLMYLDSAFTYCNFVN